MAKAENVYLAVDLGASSGRVLAGQFDGQQLTLREMHRFANGPVWANDRMYWDALQLWQSIQDGMRASADVYSEQVRSIGVDTWGATSAPD